ncbi:MAG: ECF transporter S component [Lachnospiraceae bacterium]|nr:ECF transporter S component [Lachnospiraceae bacterium]
MKNENSISMQSSDISRTRKMVQIAMLSAIAAILMYFEFPLPFAPSFYQIDFSELPIIIGGFSMGPLAGVIIEFLKILIHFIIKGTSTAGVGDVANFLVGCSFIVPASLIYKHHKSKIVAVLSLTTGTLCMTIVAVFMNAFVLLPTYATAFHMPIKSLIAMGTSINSHINNLFTFVLLAVAPFNLLKGFLISLITFLIYKKISPILHKKN